MGAVPVVRVLVVTMFDSTPGEGTGEAFRWAAREGLDRELAVPGLSEEFPVVRGSEAGLWLLTTGMGEANAAASVAALAFSGLLDLRRAYVIVAGIAGISPLRGTIGSAVWTDFAVHGGYAHELDAREMPADWPHGFVTLGASRPGRPPEVRVPGEVFELDSQLLATAHALTRDVPLADDPAVRRLRAGYPGQEPPRVLTGSTLTQSVFWSGALLSRRAEEWVSAFTDARGTYVTTQMEDNATLTALARAARAGLADLRRVAVLRTGANFDQAGPGAPPHSAFTETSGWVIAAENAYRVGSALTRRILAHWPDWADGTPAPVPDIAAEVGG